MKVALITGITGQDGSYLAEQLLEDGWEVHGIIRRLSTANTWRIQHIKDRLHLHSADLLDTGSLVRVIRETKPSQVYNLAAQSFVPVSWLQPVLTGDITAMGVTRVLEAIRLVDTSIKFYQANSSEMFGKVLETPQKETTPFYPRSPYGAAKAYGHFITQNYRESFNMFAVSGILFNHESPRRGREFVTRKVSRAVAECALGLRTSLPMGNLDAKRDWGFAGDYVGAMRLMLEADTPEDYVIATGECHTVKELCEIAFTRVGLDWQDFVYLDPQFQRPAEVDLLLGDATKANIQLGWIPQTSFTELIHTMVDTDLARLQGKLPDDTE